MRGVQFVTPKRQPRGLLMKRHPEPFFVTLSEARGPSALARLGMTFRDAVPKEVRDASLSLGRTK
jgi:hypothetical protein